LGAVAQKRRQDENPVLVPSEAVPSAKARPRPATSRSSGSPTSSTTRSAASPRQSDADLVREHPAYLAAALHAGREADLHVVWASAGHRACLDRARACGCRGARRRDPCAAAARALADGTDALLPSSQARAQL